MSSVLNELRAAAEPYKSFPKAIAALVRAAFDRGATYVEIKFGINGEGNTNVFVKDNGRELTHAQQTALVALRQACDRLFPDNIGLTFVHHAIEMRVIRSGRCVAVDLLQGVENPEEFQVDFLHHPVEIGFIALGEGEGVNAKQDRSAKRLVRELPRLLSPGEAYNTTVTDEDGNTYKLVKNIPGAIISGFRIDWSEKMIGFGREGLTLKCGAVRVSMATFLARSQMIPEERERYNLLIHPWLHGVVEVTPPPELIHIPIPTVAADNFSEEFYLQGHAVTVARPFLEMILAVVWTQIKKTIVNSVSDFARSGKFDLAGHRFSVVYATCAEIFEQGQGRVLWRDLNAHKDDLTLYLDPTHPVFWTVGCTYQEIMQIIWWQLAMWIQFHNQKVFPGEPDAQVLLARSSPEHAEQRPNPRPAFGRRCVAVFERKQTWLVLGAKPLHGCRASSVPLMPGNRPRSPGVSSGCWL